MCVSPTCGHAFRTCVAAAHEIYFEEVCDGDPVPAPHTITDAVATWPETATSVAVRLAGTDEVEICAPLGPADLLAGVWRRNAHRYPSPLSAATTSAALAR